MGSPSYLVNLDTNIGHLNTHGLLNSQASAMTTTNVGHIHGGHSSVINLGLQEMSFLDDLKENLHITPKRPEAADCDDVRSRYYSCIGNKGENCYPVAKEM